MRSRILARFVSPSALAPCRWSLLAILCTACGMGCTFGDPRSPRKPLNLWRRIRARPCSDYQQPVPAASSATRIDQDWNNLAAGTLLIANSAWSGFGSGSRFGSSQHLNLTVVRLTDGRHTNLFDRQVALGCWSYSFKPTNEQHESYSPYASSRQGPNDDLLFPNLLILTARATDTNNDKQIDDRDSVGVYLYDLAKGEHSSRIAERLPRRGRPPHGDELLLILTKEPDRKETAVYMYHIKNGTGRFVVDALTP